MWRIVLLAALAIGLAATVSLAAAQTGDQNGVLLIGSASATVGMEVQVPVEIQDVPQPGLGAWSVTIRYDPAIIAATACADETGNGICNAAFAADAARLTGAAQNGVTGNAILGELSFRCLAAGSSELILSYDVFTIAVIPPGVVIPQLQNGTITCAEPTATPLSTTAALPSTGSRGATASTPWLATAALLAGAGAIVFSAAAWRKTRP